MASIGTDVRAFLLPAAALGAANAAFCARAIVPITVNNPDITGYALPQLLYQLPALPRLGM